MVAVVELGSLVAAARRLGVSRPTLRRRLDELQVEVGVPLLVRTKRGSLPTEAGELLARRGRELIREEAAVLAEARELGGEPHGVLNIVIPTGAAPSVIATIVGGMRRQYPAVVMRVRTATDPVAALESGVDVALAFGAKQPGGRWVSMELTRVPRRLMASPAYLERAGRPQTLDDLAAHDLLAWTPPGGSGGLLPLRDGGAHHLEPILESPDNQLVRQVVGQGLGIGLVLDDPLPTSRPALVPVLEDLVGDEVQGRVIVPATLEGQARVKAFLSILRAFIATGPEAPS